MIALSRKQEVLESETQLFIIKTNIKLKTRGNVDIKRQTKSPNQRTIIIRDDCVNRDDFYYYTNYRQNVMYAGMQSTSFC